MLIHPAVRWLRAVSVSQEEIICRDIPHTTYSRLVSSGTGAAAGTGLAHGSKGMGKAAAKAARRLEPINVCESLMYTLPAVLRDTLLPFQREGVMYGLRREGRVLIADEMGTGKVLRMCCTPVLLYPAMCVLLGCVVWKITRY